MALVQKIVKWLLAIALAAAFIMFGGAKLSPRVHADTYAQLTKESHNWAKVWNPLLNLGWSAETMRTVIGVIEVIFGSLALCPHYTRLSAFMLTAVSAGAVYTHFALHQPFVIPAALGALGFLLFLVSGDSVSSSKPGAVGGQKKRQ